MGSANALDRYFARGVHFPKKVDFWKFPRYSANIAKISCNFNCGNISQEQADFLRSAAPDLLVPALFYGSTQGINGTLVSIRAGAYIGQLEITIARRPGATDLRTPPHPSLNGLTQGRYKQQANVSS